MYENAKSLTGEGGKGYLRKKLYSKWINESESFTKLTVLGHDNKWKKKKSSRTLFWQTIQLYKTQKYC